MLLQMQQSLNFLILESVPSFAKLSWLSYGDGTLPHRGQRCVNSLGLLGLFRWLKWLQEWLRIGNRLETSWSEVGDDTQPLEGKVQQELEGVVK